MCGICGFIEKKSCSEELLTDMIDEIRYRGPDDRGVFVDQLQCGCQLGLAHRRLAILDLSANGHQPMSSESGRTVISFNGEIYNFKELRRQLEQRGCHFRTGTDTEVILYAYETWGIEAVSRLNGMFAFALFDREAQCVYLVRDRMGVKPLFYYTGTEGLVFASELKPIMKHPAFQKEIDRDALTLYLAAEYIPGRQSIFRNTFKLLPGEILQWTPNGIRQWRYWSVPEVVRHQTGFRGSYEEAMESLNALVEDAVRLRMISDVPLGAFLSNGVDSSLITAKMQKLSTEPVKTFTVGFEEAAFDESQAAKRVAEYLGTDHRVQILSVREGKKLLRELPLYYDEPMADPSAIATMLVSSMAREHVTVAVSGDAGDELFCGYNTYTHFEKLRKLRGISRVLRTAGRLFPLREAAERRNRREWVKLFHMTDDEAIIDADLSAWLDRYGAVANGKADLGAFRQAMPLGTGLYEKAMLHDLTTYLPDDVLTKVDRASMAVSLETRTPLLDYRIVEFALGLPLEYKLQNGKKKRILKDLLYSEVPKEMIGQNKMGFRIPFADWLRKDYDPLVQWYFSEEFIRKQGLFDPVLTGKMLRSYQDSNTVDYAREVWTFLVFQIWYEHYIQNSSSGPKDIIPK